MILFITKCYKPWVDSRDSSKRVATIDDASREYCINPHFITDLKTHTKGSTFKYSDNFLDRRENLSTMIVDKTVAQIKAYMDTTPNSNAIKLPICPHNNPEKTPADTTIQWVNIVYADRYNPNPDNFCWVVYIKGAFKIVEVLVNLAIEDVMRLVRSGNTTTTFTSVHNFFNTSYLKTHIID